MVLDIAPSLFARSQCDHFLLSISHQDVRAAAAARNEVWLVVVARLPMRHGRAALLERGALLLAFAANAGVG